ncbi:ankyrin repeat-containing protein ITN1-like [Pistacia vera]|uniref:ankyrin repeat-containing protein ITN1-like n=1 Tax=Pistacia vera TaxID=55513 RepID=UPI001262F5C8|nr:ankyrin repeat-containing protein ITN1-like [Pistacia vera]
MATAYQLALDKKWDELENICKRQSGFDLIFPQTPDGDTLFRLAAFSKSKKPLESLLKIAEVDSITKSAYSATNIHGNTALHEAAADGNIEAINLLVAHDKKILQVTNSEGETPPLLEVTNVEGETPLFKAAAYGKEEVVRHLAPKSCTNGELKKVHRNKKRPETSILHAAIQGENFETALMLLKLDKSLGTLEDGDGITSLELLATMPSAFRSGYRMSMWKRLLYFCPLIDAKRRIGLPILRRILKDKRKHNLAFKLTLKLIKKDTTWVQIAQKILFGLLPTPGNSEVSKLATERGILEIVKEILKQTPQLAEYIDDRKRNMLHIAIMHRQKEIFDLVKEKNIPMKKLVRGIDICGCTILHYAGDMTNDNADIDRGPAYHLQEELKWYKVEKLVPTHFAMLRVTLKDDNKEEKKDDNKDSKEEKKDDNKDSKEEKKKDNKEKKNNYNCKELFKLKHDELLKEAQEWVKGTSQSCSAVAVLVATVVFAAAYTVPGGSNEKGYPIFLNNNFFLVFTVMDVVALACSLTSVVMFLSVLTSPFSYEEFHHRLPRKLTIGFSLLFVALTTTMLAFAATLLLIVRYQKPHWTTTLIYTAAFFPVSIFALTQFPMYVAFKDTFLKLFKWIKKVQNKKVPKWNKKVKKWISMADFRKRFKKLPKNDELSKKIDELSKKIDDHGA